MHPSPIASSSRLVQIATKMCSTSHSALSTVVRPRWPSPRPSARPSPAPTNRSSLRVARSSPGSSTHPPLNRRWATVIPNGSAIVERDPTYKPPEEVLEPPPAPPPAVIVHYHTDKSTLSVLCKSALEETSRARASIFENIDHEYPLDINLTVHVKGQRPSEETWTKIRKIMIEQRENKSLAATPPAVLVPPENEDEDKSGIPDNFRAPLVVNWSTRKVCRGPLMYSQLEEMLTGMRNDQDLRLRAEAKWDAYLISQGKRPPHRFASAPQKEGLQWFEKLGLLLFGWYVLDQWLLPALNKEAGLKNVFSEANREIQELKGREPGRDAWGFKR